MSVTFNFHIELVYFYATSKLASYRWACGSAGPNQSQVNEAITELWVSYSVKNNIPKHVANIAHIIWMTWDVTDDRLTAS